ncbi:hypothetical protein ES703_62672 [subsurface metagenome]
MGEKQIIRLTSPDGSEDVIEMDVELWERFQAKAKELGMTEQELFVIALDTFLMKERD